MYNHTLSDPIRSIRHDEPIDRWGVDPEREPPTEASRRNKRFALSIFLPPLFSTLLYLPFLVAFSDGAILWLYGLFFAFLFTLLPGVVYWAGLELLYREGWLRNPFAHLVAGTFLGFVAGIGVLFELRVMESVGYFGVEMVFLGGLIGAIVAMIIRYVAPPLGLRAGWKWNVVVIDDAGREMREAVNPVRMVGRVIGVIVKRGREMGSE